MADSRRLRQGYSVPVMAPLPAIQEEQREFTEVTEYSYDMMCRRPALGKGLTQPGEVLRPWSGPRRGALPPITNFYSNFILGSGAGS